MYFRHSLSTFIRFIFLLDSIHLQCFFQFLRYLSHSSKCDQGRVRNRETLIIQTIGPLSILIQWVVARHYFLSYTNRSRKTGKTFSENANVFRLNRHFAWMMTRSKCSIINEIGKNRQKNEVIKLYLFLLKIDW